MILVSSVLILQGLVLSTSGSLLDMRDTGRQPRPDSTRPSLATTTASASEESAATASGDKDAGTVASLASTSSASSTKSASFAHLSESAVSASSAEIDTPSHQGSARDPMLDSAPKEDSWFRRVRPQRNTWQLGAFGGVFMPAKGLELYSPDPKQLSGGYKRLRPLNADIGARVGYLILPFLATEIEGAFSPAQAHQSKKDAWVWNAKVQALGQIPRGRIVPFATVGAGVIGVASDPEVVGNDVDLMLHFGGGLKFLLHKRSLLRLDVRDVLSQRQGVAEGASHNLEATLGVSVVLGKAPVQETAPPKPMPAPEPAPEPEPEPIDPCDEAYEGDPADCPTYDTDEDGVPDLEDQCVDEAGPAPEGCPEKDSDGDGFLDSDDKCPDEPETVNTFEDTDGCPDELPEEVKAFAGVIQGINFYSGKSTITKASRRVLDRALATLLEYEDITLEIAGYTDDRGNDEHNAELSLERANAVRDYLVDRGVASSRLTTRGYGEEDPIASNQTKGGRAQNRRIEFHIGK